MSDAVTAASPSTAPGAEPRPRVPQELTNGQSPSGAHGTDAVKRTTHRWARWLHVYTSMAALFITLFFGITGFTLNHPELAFGESTTTTTTTGTLIASPLMADGTVNWLGVAEELRADHNIKGRVSDFSVNGSEGSIVFVNPGYSATVFFDTGNGEFKLDIVQQGFVAAMNDLHKGRDTGSGWRWVIDGSAVFLVAISVSGLTMQFFLRKRRRSALISAVVGGVISIAVIWITVS